jgi:hypothetical protein
MAILKLTLKRQWFDEIAAGKKKTEYREIKPHWNQRLLIPGGEFKTFDEVHFRNGYDSRKPFMRVKWEGCNLGIEEGEPCYCIALGEILEVRNY